MSIRGQSDRNTSFLNFILFIVSLMFEMNNFPLFIIIFGFPDEPEVNNFNAFDLFIH